MRKAKLPRTKPASVDDRRGRDDPLHLSQYGTVSNLYQKLRPLEPRGPVDDERRRTAARRSPRSSELAQGVARAASAGAGPSGLLKRTRARPSGVLGRGLFGCGWWKGWRRARSSRYDGPGQTAMIIRRAPNLEVDERASAPGRSASAGRGGARARTVTGRVDGLSS